MESENIDWHGMPDYEFECVKQHFLDTFDDYFPSEGASEDSGWEVSVYRPDTPLIDARIIRIPGFTFGLKFKDGSTKGFYLDEIADYSAGKIWLLL